MNHIQRTSSFICRESDLEDEIMRLNSQGWYVSSGRQTDKINQIALQCVHVGYKAKETQEKFACRLY